MNLWSLIYPRTELLRTIAECDRLRAERATLIQAQQNATQAATEARLRLTEALERENAALTRESIAVKQVANYAVFAGGSRIPIFPGIGPELPAPKYATAPEPVQGRQRASEVARAGSRNYLSEYMKQQPTASEIDIDAELNAAYEQAKEQPA